MESDIKCLECGRITRNFELGEVICDFNKPSKTLLVKDTLMCPKCKKDISNEKFAIKENDMLMKLVAANISISIGNVPKHLKRAYCLETKIYNRHKSPFNSKPKLVGKF